MALPEQLQTESDFFKIFSSIAADYEQLTAMQRQLEELRMFAEEPDGREEFMGLTADSALTEYAGVISLRRQEKSDFKRHLRKQEIMARGLLLGRAVSVGCTPSGDRLRIWRRHDARVFRAAGTIVDARFSETGFLPSQDPDTGVITIQEEKRWGRPDVYDVQPLRMGLPEVSVALLD